MNVFAIMAKPTIASAGISVVHGEASSFTTWLRNSAQVMLSYSFDWM